MSKRYEYTELPAYGSRPRTWITQFNELGEKGWRFIGTDAFRTTLFIRELEDGNTANEVSYECLAPTPPPAPPMPPAKIPVSPKPAPAPTPPRPVFPTVTREPEPPVAIKKKAGRPKKSF